MIHYTELDDDSETIMVCDACGSEDSIVSNGDCGGCTECYSIENYSSRYLGKDGNLYKDKEINWNPKEDVCSG